MEQRTVRLVKVLARFVEELIEALTFVLFALVFYSLWRHEFVFFLWAAESFMLYMALAVFCVACSIWHLAKCIVGLYSTLRGSRSRKSLEEEVGF